VVGRRSESLLLNLGHRRKLALLGVVLLVILLLATIILLRSRTEDGFRWMPSANPGTATVVDAYVGKPLLVMGRVRILVKSVDRVRDSFSAEVTVTNEPEMDIRGRVRSRFRDKDSTIEIQAADLGQEFVMFELWTIQH
jgi:hypothetical protein